MTLRLFEEPSEVTEPIQQEDVSLPTRLLFCAWASVVAVVPTITTTYSAWGVSSLIRSMKNAEDVKTTTVLAQLHMINTPLVIALGVAALLAFGIALALAINPKHRLASVGLPFSIGVPIIAATPALFLWFAETTTLDVLAGKITNTPIPVIARNVGILLFCALALGLLAQGATFVCAIISLLIRAQSRTEALSINRAIVWAISGTLLLTFAAAYLVLA